MIRGLLLWGVRKRTLKIGEPVHRQGWENMLYRIKMDKYTKEVLIMINTDAYCPEYLLSTIPQIFDIARKSDTIEAFRQNAAQYVHKLQYEPLDEVRSFSEGTIIRVRDCAQAVNQIFSHRSEEKSNFSVAEALWDISHNRPRPDLSSAFYAEMLHLFLGLHGKGPRPKFADYHLVPSSLDGREAAIERSSQLDTLSEDVTKYMDRYSDGLDPASVDRRQRRRDQILKKLGASLNDWEDWRWQYGHVMRDPEMIQQLVNLSPAQAGALDMARKIKIPFGITPYYLSLMDEDPDSERDIAIRSQVLPPSSYVDQISEYDGKENSCLDFMREADTSPIDLIPRRYPSICIFKPFNSCPQICVYCQRNWEIKDIADSKFSYTILNNALEWIHNNKNITEVLVTGGDPLCLGNKQIGDILEKLSKFDHIERIRIGTRTLVTLPYRINDSFIELLNKYNVPGRREVCIITHFEHFTEITSDVIDAVSKIRKAGVSIYNQQVFTYYNSFRYETAYLRKMLKLSGIDPYYTFNTKGKDETIDFRVPIARIEQERKEEARFLPGIVRTDEPVFNLPKLGKSHLRAWQDHEPIMILDSGERIYRFFPWESKVTMVEDYLYKDVPIYNYLKRLQSDGENIEEYGSIWYYF